MSFESGYGLAMAAQNQQATQARQAEMDRRSLELHQMQMAQLQRDAARQKALDGIEDQITDSVTNNGLGKGLRDQVGSTYGMTADQMKAPDLAAKVESYNAPDSYDLQNQSAAEFKAKGIDINRAKSTSLSDLMMLHAAKAGDMKAVGQLRAQRQLEDAHYAGQQAHESWNTMTDQQRAATITRASANEAIPGIGAWVAGNKSKPGYMHYEAPNGTVFQLSANDVGLMARADAMDKILPGSGDTIRAQASTNARQAAQHMSANAEKNAEVNNTGMFHQEHMENERNKANAQIGHQNRMEQISKMGQVRIYEDPKTGQKTEMYPEMTKTGVQWKPVPMPGGLRPYIPKEVPPVMSAADYFNNFGGSPSGEPGQGGKPKLVRELTPQQFAHHYSQYVAETRAPSDAPTGGAQDYNPGGGAVDTSANSAIESRRARDKKVAPAASADSTPYAGLPTPSDRRPWSQFPAGSAMEMAANPVTYVRGGGFRYNGLSYPTREAAEAVATRDFQSK